ncbi:WD40-repeat-containing domain protein [Fusarium flagelliforme]|uniref:WD40-repeat-containing domain protein n=1 Tax=Fusarium flagelliforme TaxID=2675880 RepID=UPI001E8ED33C|nr:WD40-repeat-containing domain protein [Fusarium flagelliforme]KAH7192196.1 WD40-repeat-containing domain protein [Fusarium flagelliforme]
MSSFDPDTLPTPSSSSRPKGTPSITPRRFNRFWQPRQAQTQPLPKFRTALGILDESDINQQPISPQSLFIPSSPTERFQDDSRKRKLQTDESETEGGFKRPTLNLDDMPPLRLTRSSSTNLLNQDGLKASGSLSSSISSENLDSCRKATLSSFFKTSRGAGRTSKKGNSTTTTQIVPEEPQLDTELVNYAPRPIRKFANRGFDSQLLNREHGFGYSTGQSLLHTPACDPRVETARFHSRCIDSHELFAPNSDSHTIPFCLASTHNANVTALGDEEGCVRFFDTSPNDDPSVDKQLGVHNIHDNAIWDMDFSHDDMRLATTAGDAGLVMDVTTKTVAARLSEGHLSSTRQIAWQEGQSVGNVLTTSDKAGRIRLWDLRCAHSQLRSFSTVSYDESGRRTVTMRDETSRPLQAVTANTLDNTHERNAHGKVSVASVTAIQWLPAGREHLLLSASEAEAVVKLWDLRYINRRHQEKSIPLSSTTVPSNHAWRSYGITSLALSSDAARMYAVCKDSTIYAYSMAHLMLGHAPELKDDATKRRPVASQGLGPLYGFRHDSFAARTFFVKCSMRQKGLSHSSDLLAVGSSESSVVLFPTDERYLRSACAQRAHLLDPPGSAPTPSRSFSSNTGAEPSSSTTPIFRNGTALVNGHTREVSNVSWSHDGKLVSASDDHLVRQWQEDDGRARYFRQVGDFGGERFNAGWADVGDDWDVDDDE